MRLEPSIGLDLCPVWRDMLARSVIFKKSAGLSIGGVGMQASEQYFLGHSPVEQRRLQQQAQELAQESTWLFDQIGIGPGSRVVEIGCGPQGCLELLSDRVGAEGYVIGVELSEPAVETARGFLADR